MKPWLRFSFALVGLGVLAATWLPASHIFGKDVKSPDAAMDLNCQAQDFTSFPKICEAGSQVAGITNQGNQSLFLRYGRDQPSPF